MSWAGQACHVTCSMAQHSIAQHLVYFADTAGSGPADICRHPRVAVYWFESCCLLWCQLALCCIHLGGRSPDAYIQLFGCATPEEKRAYYYCCYFQAVTRSGQFACMFLERMDITTGWLARLDPHDQALDVWRRARRPQMRMGGQPMMSRHFRGPGRFNRGKSCVIRTCMDGQAISSGPGKRRVRVDTLQSFIHQVVVYVEQMQGRPAN